MGRHPRGAADDVDPLPLGHRAQLRAAAHRARQRV